MVLIIHRYLLGIMAALFIGFSFYKQNTTSTGLQNTIFAIFMIVTYVLLVWNA